MRGWAVTVWQGSTDVRMGQGQRGGRCVEHEAVGTWWGGSGGPRDGTGLREGCGLATPFTMRVAAAGGAAGRGWTVVLGKEQAVGPQAARSASGTAAALAAQPANGCVVCCSSLAVSGWRLQVRCG